MIINIMSMDEKKLCLPLMMTTACQTAPQRWR